MQYEKLFRTQSVWKSIFSLAVPSVIIILVMILYNMTDMFFMGQLGETKTGISFCFLYMVTAQCLCNQHTATAT